MEKIQIQVRLGLVSMSQTLKYLLTNILTLLNNVKM